MRKAALYAAAILFAIGALVHLVRLLIGFQIVVDTFRVPVWVSLPGAVVGGLLAIWMIAAAREP